MHFKITSHYSQLLSLLIALSVSACTTSSNFHVDSFSKERGFITLFNFEEPTIPAGVSFESATGILTPADASSGKQALKVNLDSSTHGYTGISLLPDTPWNWSELKDFSLAFDIANRGEVSAQIYLDIEDIDSAVNTRSVSVPVGDSNTYYAKMHGHDLATATGDGSVELNLGSGLRSNPPTWQSKSVKFVSMWGKKNLNLAGIKQISLSVQDVLRDKQFTVDNIRLFYNPPQDVTFLSGLVDRYGQNAKIDFVGKIHSDAELAAQRDAELNSLAGGALMRDRSRYSGWKNGPKLEATGYFRTEKVNGKWALVDPEGYIYFATGLDIIRLSNSTTITGYDFDPDLIEQRAAGDTTPEDSVGLNTVAPEALPTRKEVAAIRTGLFQWLPSYEEDLGNHYGYRREVHSGPVKHGETYSFYSANLERKYGESSPQSYLDAWEEVTINRMRNWGFTSLGNWTDPRYYDQVRIPFFANGWIIGDFKTVSSGNDFWSPMPDVFDPMFEERAMVTAATVAAEVKGSPWCVGVFIDNEKSFGRSETDEARLGIVIHTLRRNGEEVPTKRAFTKLMKNKYVDVNELNRAWNKDIASWEDFDNGIDSSISSPTQTDDYSSLLEAYADKYFAVVNKAMKQHMPNHLYLGARFPDWGMPKEVVKAAARHVDVMSYNSYKEGLTPHKWAFLDEIDMPSIIGEFHIGASDSGLFHPGLIHASDQQDRARMYQEYMHSAIDNPYFVGAHWFQYLDSPITGRAYDGENYNVGFVNVADVPYQQMVEAARELHSKLYTRRYPRDDRL